MRIGEFTKLHTIVRDFTGFRMFLRGRTDVGLHTVTGTWDSQHSTRMEYHYA